MNAYPSRQTGQSIWPYPAWIAHRGAGQEAPENTMAAFRHGASRGFRMFECDAKLSADGVVFLLHDATLERTTNGQGIAGQCHWNELSKLDAGSWHSRTFAGEPLATLENLARYCLANGYFLNIEIKPTPGDEAITGQRVAQEAARLWESASTPPLLTSFQPECLAAAQLAAVHLPRGLLIHTLWPQWMTVAQELHCSAIVANHKVLDQEVVSQVHSSGLQCMSYTVNNSGDVRRLLSIGVDGIITDEMSNHFKHPQS